MDSHKATEGAQPGPPKILPSARRNLDDHTSAESARRESTDHFIGSQAFIAACRAPLYRGNGEKNGVCIPTGRILFANVRTPRIATDANVGVSQERSDVDGWQGSERSITAPQIVWEGPSTSPPMRRLPRLRQEVRPQPAQAFPREMLKEASRSRRKRSRKRKRRRATDKQLRTAREKPGVRWTRNRERWRRVGWQPPDPSDGKYYY
jgi:hypothetical protein